MISPSALLCYGSGSQPVLIWLWSIPGYSKLALQPAPNSRPEHANKQKMGHVKTDLHYALYNLLLCLFLSQLKIPTPKHFYLSYSIFYCLAEKGMLKTINKKQNFLQSLKNYSIANKKHKWMSPISDYIYVHLHWPVYQQKMYSVTNSESVYTKY